MADPMAEGDEANMSPRESDGFLKSAAKSLVEEVLRGGRFLGLGILGLLVLMGVLMLFVHFRLGLGATYAAATALIVLMGWSAYSTDRDAFLAGGFAVHVDIVDVVAIFVVWFAVIAITAQYDVEVGDGGFLAIALGVTWFRRVFFPSTVLRYQSKNALLRTTAVLCIVHSLVTALFGITADAIDAPAYYVRVFYLIAGLLVAVAVWIHRVESRHLAE